jgi:hypothetical protein
MYKLNKGKALLVALGLGLSCAFGAPAAATDFHITKAIVPSTPGALIGTIYDAGITGGSEQVRIGRIQLTGTDEFGGAVSFDTYCFDIFDILQPGTFSTADISTAPYDAARIAAATTFLAHADGMVTNSTTSAAAQLGVWEILNESDGTTWNVTSGSFHAGVSTAAANLANGWLASLASNDWQPDPTLSLQLLVPQAGNQLQVMLVAGSPEGLPTPAVPEPASWAMMLGGFGLVGGSLRSQRRKRSAGVAA